MMRACSALRLWLPFFYQRLFFSERMASSVSNVISMYVVASTRICNVVWPGQGPTRKQLGYKHSNVRDGYSAHRR